MASALQRALSACFRPAAYEAARGGSEMNNGIFSFTPLHFSCCADGIGWA